MQLTLHNLSIFYFIDETMNGVTLEVNTFNFDAETGINIIDSKNDVVIYHPMSMIRRAEVNRLGPRLELSIYLKSGESYAVQSLDNDPGYADQFDQNTQLIYEQITKSQVVRNQVTQNFVGEKAYKGDISILQQQATRVSEIHKKTAYVAVALFIIFCIGLYMYAKSND